MKFRLEDIRIEFVTEKPSPKNPKFIQGLLGVGQVGFLAVRQLIKSLNARKVADVYSPDFLYPGSTIPGVIYTRDGTVELEKDEIYYDEKNELFLLTGLYQGIRPEGYFGFASRILDLCDEFNVKEIYTLAGYGTGRRPREPDVYAVITDKSQEPLLRKHGIKIPKAPEGSLGVTGLAGLLVVLGAKNGRKTLCLMGETHGNYPDPKAAKAVLLKLCRILKIDIDTTQLDEQIKEMEKEFRKIGEYMRKIAEVQKPQPVKPEDLPYIG
jgi:hypothetical protein